MILNLHYAELTTTNVAEYYTQPVDYFPWDEDIVKAVMFHDVDRYLEVASLVIIGGSGIHNAYTWQRLEEIVERTPSETPIVVWGMGVNDHGRLDRRYPETLQRLEAKSNVLIGLRDHFYKTYVPCASCLRPELEARFPIQYEVGLYVHKQFDISLSCPTMSNRVEDDPLSSFWRVLKFIGSCETVVTNTYHGAYWATLLNRRVVVAAPFSNKFLGFKYEPIIVTDSSNIAPMLKYATRYPQALNDSREVNQSFYRRVQSFKRDRRGNRDIGTSVVSSTP